MRFSQRIGKKQVREVLQLDSIDAALYNRLWNLILNTLFAKLEQLTQKDAQAVCDHIWTEFFNERKDEAPEYYTMYDSDFRAYLKAKFFDIMHWYEIYDLLEFISELDSKILHTEFMEKCNYVLKRELSGYRLIDNKVIKTTSEDEISAIETAINDSSAINSVNIHLRTSLELLSNRENPDYRNSIKESISAVESICAIIVKDDSATLGAAIKVIEKKYRLHKALKSAFSSLYGYTSDSGGIRHSLLEDDVEVTFEDAKFMLVSCSAFINYLNEKIKHNISAVD
ncbi:AbiJ-NTD4 domain-containing protein [Roseivirga seohaensis]|uniref:AbiJ-NTD4 domain-containing protein n=1 Tax=Roseivirga seohaensis TaxID=1914963 RepID=UPI0008F69145|nr:hypothetical protein [Roseivirga seohaensis]